MSIQQSGDPLFFVLMLEEFPSVEGVGLPSPAPPKARAVTRVAVFDKADWWSFGVTTAAALTLYLGSLAPDVSLGFSGIFSTGSRYLGVAHPPGYPLSTLWAWLFIELLPFGNIAWRVAVSSATAGALTCGLIALMVSRSGANLVKQIRGIQQDNERQERRLRMACGFAAGMVFGANGAFWREAVIANVWTLSILMLCLVICLLLRWIHRPGEKRYLYAAALSYGLMLTNSQIQLAFAPAIPFLVWAGDRRAARDMFAFGTLLFMAGLAGLFVGKLPLIGDDWNASHRFFKLFIIGGAITTAGGAGLVLLTGRLFTEWKSILACVAAGLLGLFLYLYVPIASMTNPPMNWGYARTVPGFWHVMTRGQYERLMPSNEISVFARQVSAYGAVTAKEFGFPFLPIVVVPVFFIRRFRVRERGWMLGMLAAYVSLAFLMLAVLNPQLDRAGLERVTVYFSASYVVLALGLGCGLTVIGAHLLKQHDPPEPMLKLGLDQHTPQRRWR
ncbi:MAG: hypothetical protein QOF48_1507 [Verrucomicrobiota bacterium]